MPRFNARRQPAHYSPRSAHAAGRSSVRWWRGARAPARRSDTRPALGRPAEAADTRFPGRPGALASAAAASGSSATTASARLLCGGRTEQAFHAGARRRSESSSVRLRMRVCRSVRAGESARGVRVSESKRVRLRESFSLRVRRRRRRRAGRRQRRSGSRPTTADARRERRRAKAAAARARGACRSPRVRVCCQSASDPAPLCRGAARALGPSNKVACIRDEPWRLSFRTMGPSQRRR